MAGRNECEDKVRDRLEKDGSKDKEPATSCTNRKGSRAKHRPSGEGSGEMSELAAWRRGEAEEGILGGAGNGGCLIRGPIWRAGCIALSQRGWRAPDGTVIRLSTPCSGHPTAGLAVKR